MEAASNIQFTIQFVDPELDAEERDEQAMRLLNELREVDELEDVGRVLDPNPPAGNKSLGGFLAGMLRGEAEPSNLTPVVELIGDRSAHKDIEVELAQGDRTLKLAATRREDLQDLMPVLQAFLMETSREPEQAQRTILLMTANPSETSRLRLDQEIRDITAGLERSSHREQLLLKTQLATRPRDIQRAMLDTTPSIVHFSGHAVSESGGADGGLVFEDDNARAHLVDGESLASLFKLFADQLDCVILNGCYSESQAEAISQHVDYVVGMNKAIGDRAAIEFAVGFYDALGAGRPIEFAFELGRNAIRLARLEGHDIPVLKRRVATAVV